MMTQTWTGTLTALSSIAHGGETRGTRTLLRRELVARPDGRLVYVPIISGNTLRGRLRRIGEELLRDTLQYEGLIPAAAAHALRGGGALAKTGGEPLSGSRLQRLRNLIPQIGVFGAAGGGTIIDGALDVGKVVPIVAETSQITGVGTDRSALEATQLEAYTRQDDAAAHDFQPVLADAAVPPSGDTGSAELIFDETGRPDVLLRGSGQQMLFHLETFPAGTVFSTWLRLRRPTELESAFFADVLAIFCTEGRLGGRVGIGHGLVRVNLAQAHDERTGEQESSVDWRATVKEHQDEVVEALGQLG